MKITLFCFFVLILVCFNSYSQDDWQKYEVDSTVVSIIKSKANGSLKSTLEFKYYENDSLILDFKSNKKPIESFTTSRFKDDTLIITGWIGMFSGIGFTAKIIGDKCLISHFVSSESPGYKLNISDSLTTGLLVPCTTSHLLLSKKPAIDEFISINGIINLVSESYYTESRGGLKEVRMEITSHFVAKSQATILRDLKDPQLKGIEKENVVRE